MCQLDNPYSNCTRYISLTTNYLTVCVFLAEVTSVSAVCISRSRIPGSRFRDQSIAVSAFKDRLLHKALCLQDRRRKIFVSAIATRFVLWRFVTDQTPFDFIPLKPLKGERSCNVKSATCTAEAYQTRFTIGSICDDRRFLQPRDTLRSYTKNSRFGIQPSLYYIPHSHQQSSTCPVW